MNNESKVVSPESRVMETTDSGFLPFRFPGDLDSIQEEGAKYGFENLIAWTKARELNKLVYDLFAHRRARDDWALQDQIRRASLSIMSNIAEGAESGTDKEFARFLSIAKASCAEVRSHLYAALDTDRITKVEFEALHCLSSEVARLVGGLLSSVRRRIKTNGVDLGTRISGQGTK